MELAEPRHVGDMLVYGFLRATNISKACSAPLAGSARRIPPSSPLGSRSTATTCAPGPRHVGPTGGIPNRPLEVSMEDEFDLDISVLESGDGSAALINLTDDGCKSSCPESCATNVV